MTAAAIRAVIVDDEPTAREAVRSMLARRADVVIVGEAANGREAVTVLRAARPDLVFLDVQMPDANGFAVLDALGPDVPRAVVFVTAHDEHAVRAFEVHALDYVLKPFGPHRFDAAVSRALERLRAIDALTLQETLASMAGDRSDATGAPGELATESGAPALAVADTPKRIGVRHGSRVVLVDVESIDWVEADGDYARIHAGKQSYLVSQRMRALEQMLERGGFIRTHRSVIVRADRISELHREGDGAGFLVLRSGVRLRVARGRWDDLARALDYPGVS